MGHATMGVCVHPSIWAFQNSIFLVFQVRQTHEIFKVSKYRDNIKFDKTWEYQNGGPSK